MFLLPDVIYLFYGLSCGAAPPGKRDIRKTGPYQYLFFDCRDLYTFPADLSNGFIWHHLIVGLMGIDHTRHFFQTIFYGTVYYRIRCHISINGGMLLAGGRRFFTQVPSNVMTFIVIGGVLYTIVHLLLPEKKDMAASCCMAFFCFGRRSLPLRRSVTRRLNSPFACLNYT
jgi:hypothetical protein